MRTLEDIQQQILNKANQQEVLQPLVANTSTVSAFHYTVYIFAYAIWVFENLLEVFKAEVEKRIAQTRVHNRSWYRLQALAYMHGFAINEFGGYNTNELSQEQMTQAKIITQVAVVRALSYGQGVLRIKLAKGITLLEPLTLTELEAFGAYMNQVTDAGTVVVCTSNVADDLKLTVNCYYDPTVLDNQGRRLDGTNDTPVIQAIENYLKSLDFNSNFIKTDLNDVIQKVPGINTASRIQNAWSKYGAFSYDVQGTLLAGEIIDIRTADAGYMHLDIENTIINYIAYVTI